MPHLGLYHDDGIYCVGAKSLAEGHDYRILSLPDQPHQTKYPPLFPALLALVWKANPAFPANLPLAALLLWLLLPVYLLAVRAVLRRYGFSPLEQMLLVLIAGFNPLCALFSFTAMPELLIASLLVLSLLLADRSPALSGVAAALAYLTRSSALPLLVTVPAVLMAQRRFRDAARFAAAMLPGVVAWQVWVWRHVSPARDPVTLYYTNYFGLELQNVSLPDLPAVVWHNVDALLIAIGKLLLFDVESFAGRHLERVIAVAAIAGIVRIARRTGAWQVPCGALGYAALLAVWCYRPDERCVFPLFPLLLAGLWTELSNLSRTVRTAWIKGAADRMAACAVASALASLAVFVTFTHVHGLTRTIPNLVSAYQTDLDRRKPAYAWIAAHVPASENVFAYDDPVLFLYAGRKSCSLMVPPKLIYYDQPGTDAMVRAIPEFAQEHHLEYLLATSDDFYRDLHARAANELARSLESHSNLKRVFASPAASVYRLTPQPDTITTNALTLCDSDRGLLGSPVCRKEAHHP